MTSCKLKAGICYFIEGICSFVFVVMEAYFDLNFVLFEDENEEMVENERVTSIELTNQEILDIGMSFQGKIQDNKMSL